MLEALQCQSTSRLPQTRCGIQLKATGRLQKHGAPPRRCTLYRRKPRNCNSTLCCTGDSLRNNTRFTLHARHAAAAARANAFHILMPCCSYSDAMLLPHVRDSCRKHSESNLLCWFKAFGLREGASCERVLLGGRNKCRRRLPALAWLRASGCHVTAALHMRMHHWSAAALGAEDGKQTKL